MCHDNSKVDRIRKTFSFLFKCPELHRLYMLTSGIKSPSLSYSQAKLSWKRNFNLGFSQTPTLP